MTGDVYTCSKCKQEQPTINYHPDKGCKKGFYSWCKTCKSNHRKWLRVNSFEYREKRRLEKLSPNIDHVRRKRTTRRWHIKNIYGVTEDFYESKLIEQNNSCAICKQTVEFILNNSPRFKYLAIDHDHTTNKVRGLLCDRCNKGLGLFKDNKQALLEAVEYLRKYE